MKFRKKKLAPCDLCKGRRKIPSATRPDRMTGNPVRYMIDCPNCSGRGTGGRIKKK